MPRSSGAGPTTGAIRAFEVVGVGRARLGERSRPALASGSLRVRPDAVGICATDLELVDGTLVYVRNGRTTFPLVPGHEWTGIVDSVAPDVEGIVPGDRVVGECSIGCGACETCRQGRYHLCPTRRETGLLGMDGALAEAFTFPARAAHRVDSGVMAADAALIEPLAVAVRGLRRGGDAGSGPTLVVGAGTIGRLAVMAAPTVLGRPVHVLTTAPERLATALGLGARPHVDGTTYPLVVEATGSERGLTAAHAALAPGGRLVVLGLTGRPTVQLRVDALVVADQEIVGSLGSPRTWREAIALVETGAVRPSRIVTHRFALERIQEAIDLIRARPPGLGKVLIEPQG